MIINCAPGAVYQPRTNIYRPGLCYNIPRFAVSKQRKNRSIKSYRTRWSPVLAAHLHTVLSTVRLNFLFHQSVLPMAFTLLTCLLLIFISNTVSASKVSCPPDATLASNVSAVSFTKLPSTHSAATHPQHSTAFEQIRNTLALYPLAIDGKDFAALDLVFSQDVVANYSAPLNMLTPLSTVQSVLQKSLAFVQSQHKLSTQVIEIIPQDCQAMTLTYFEATHFGQDNYIGQVCACLSRASAGARIESGITNLIHRQILSTYGQSVIL